MKIRPGTPPVVILGLLLGAGLQDPGLRAQGEKPVKDFTDADPEKLGPAGPGEGGPADWLRRGGGKNPTDRVRGLMEINGRTIAEQEADMRPGVKSEVGSEKGFLGQDERLLDVLAADNRYVVDEQRRTHQELARHLHLLARIGAGFDDREFLYHGSRFKVTGMNRATPGHPPSAFRDGTTANQEAKVHNLVHDQAAFCESGS